jgi:hypothetical protein
MVASNMFCISHFSQEPYSSFFRGLNSFHLLVELFFGDSTFKASSHLLISWSGSRLHSFSMVYNRDNPIQFPGLVCEAQYRKSSISTSPSLSVSIPRYLPSACATCTCEVRENQVHRNNTDYTGYTAKLASLVHKSPMITSTIAGPISIIPWSRWQRLRCSIRQETTRHLLFIQSLLTSPPPLCSFL